MKINLSLDIYSTYLQSFVKNRIFLDISSQINRVRRSRDHFEERSSFLFFFWFISQSNYTKKKKKEETKEYTNTSPRSRARAQHDTWAGSVFWLCARNKGKDRAVPFGRKNSCASLNSSSRCTSWRTSSRGAPLCTASKYRAAVGHRRADLWLKQGSVMLHQSMIILSSCEGEKEEEKQKKRRKIEKNIYI